MAVTTRDVAAIQRYFPQIYLACHTRHRRRRSHPEQLTAHDSSLLAHLSEDRPLRASTLARHLGVGASTLSASLKRLASLGYVVREADARDKRAARLRLSAQGASAIQASSVLDSERLAALLARLTSTERTRAVEGLRLLAEAALSLRKKEIA
jgi:DNA-binding MarR family transcriptional regulator